MKTKTIIIIAIASILLLGAGTYLWQEAFKRGKLAGQNELSTAIFNEIGQSGYLKVPTKQGEFAVLQLIKDEKGQVIIYKEEQQ